MATSPLRKNKKQNQSNNKAPQTQKGNEISRIKNQL